MDRKNEAIKQTPLRDAPGRGFLHFGRLIINLKFNLKLYFNLKLTSIVAVKYNRKQTKAHK